MQTWYVFFNGSSTAIIQKTKKILMQKNSIFKKNVIFKWKKRK